MGPFYTDTLPPPLFIPFIPPPIGTRGKRRKRRRDQLRETPAIVNPLVS